MSQEVVFTIGYSNHSFDHFVELLRVANIDAIADVRSTPYSRINPSFSQENLKPALKRCGVSYAFLGRELGARSSDMTVYSHGRVQYSRLALTESFQHGLQRIKKGSETFRIAMMCAEREPLECHRAVLISRHLQEKNIDVGHILASFSVEPHLEMEARLVKLIFGENPDLFLSRKELLDEAYARQGERIAFVDEAAEQGT